MSARIAWIAAQAVPEFSIGGGEPRQLPRTETGAVGRSGPSADELVSQGMRAHTFDGRSVARIGLEDEEYERRTYRGRTVALLRRYMRYAMETGRLPSLLGSEFFRTRVTAYAVVTFEDRIIFVHDMEKCLSRMDEFSQQLIARHILQEHDQLATSKLLHCSERTVRRHVPLVLDVLSEILLEMGLMERLGSSWEKSCQED